MIDSKLAPFARRALGIWRLPVTFAALAAALCTSSQAVAGDVAAASQLFDEAKLLLEAGQLEAACTKFEASYDSDPQLGALMNLADCLERDGRLASSFGRWGDAIDLASRKGDERVDYARSRRETIAPLLSFITLNVIGEGPDLIVYKGNARLSAGAYGSALPSNPGETVIQVVRGEDLLKSTARQLLVYEALGATHPLWCHEPLVRDAEGHRLAKRHAPLSLQHFRERGMTPAEAFAAAGIPTSG